MRKTPPPRGRRRDPVRIAGWALRWIAVPVLIGVFVSGNLDFRSLPFFGRERETAVLLLDGQAYFGHLDDSGESGWLTLHDVYYLTDAKGAPTNVAVSLVQRGGEAHEPSDGMRINRDRVLAVERVGADSAVARAIAAQRQMLGAQPAPLAANPQAIGDTATLTAQRTAAEHSIARGYAAQIATLTKLNTELVLPVSKAEAAAITQKATDDLKSARHAALVALATATGLRSNDAEAYARAAETRIDNQSFTNEQGTLLAPNLNGVVVTAAALYSQVTDAASKQLTQPRATASPSPSPSASPTARP